MIARVWTAAALSISMIWPLSSAAQRSPAASMQALSSYQHLPLIADDDRGLASLFVQLLNERLDRKLNLITVPRRRLIETYLSDNRFEGLALFLTPGFLPDGLTGGGEWSRAVLSDENLLVSTRVLQLKAWADLEGLRLGGILGHVYRPLQSMIAGGRIRREDAVDQVANLGKLCRDRLDVLVMSQAEFLAAAPSVPCEKRYQTASMPDPDVFQRRVLVRTPDKDLARHLVSAIDAIACSSSWREAVRQRGLMPAICSDGGR